MPLVNYYKNTLLEKNIIKRRLLFEKKASNRYRRGKMRRKTPETDTADTAITRHL